MDGRIAVWSATHRVALLNDPFVWLGTIDKLGAVWIVLALAVGLWLRRGAWGTLGLMLLMGLTTLAADSLSFAVKDLTHRTRPFEAHPEIHPLYVVHSSSFPAGHASTAFAGAVLLSFVAPRLAPVFFGLAVLIGFSRVYVGVHYPTDVLAGALLGSVVGAGAAFAYRFSGERLAHLGGRWRNVRSAA
jgi:undecaprenyl-diphosphatase